MTNSETTVKKRSIMRKRDQKQYEEGEGMFYYCSSPKVKTCIIRTLSRVSEFCGTYALVLGMILVLIIGVQLPALGLFFAKLRTEYICTVLAFFACGLQLTDGECLAAVKNVKAIVLGSLVILLIIPALGVEITKTIHFATLTNENMTTEHSVVQANMSVIGPTEVAMGLQVFYAVTATLSIGAILVVISGGDKALTLLLMFITNVLGVFTVPLLLRLMTDMDDVVPFKDVGLLVVVMVLTVHIPAAVGRTLRFSHRVSTLVDSWSGTVFHYLTISLLLLITLPHVSRAVSDDKYANIVAMNLLTIVGYSSIMHVMFLLITWTFSAALSLDVPSKKVIVIVGSHKALVFALKLLRFMPSESLDSQGLMSVSCIIAYLTVLVLDSVVVSKWATMMDEESEHDDSAVDSKYHNIPQDE